MALYEHRLHVGTSPDMQAEALRKVTEIERQLHLAGMRAERSEINRLARNRELPDDVARKLVREVDLLEARVTIASSS